MTPNLAPDLDAIPQLLDFLARRGCHGALLLGTTGEGPSFSPDEREAIFRAAVRVRQAHPDFRLLAGTGTPSLEETIQLNKTAFDLGFDGVLVLPPFYYRTAPEDGLFAWFSQVLDKSIPADGWLLGYHFPNVSGVPLSHSLLTRLRDVYPNHFGGIKDSSGDLAHAQTTVKALPEQAMLVGNDRLLLSTLETGGAGCITALANLVSPLLREIYDAYTKGQSADATQAKVNAARSILDHYRPFPASVKGLLSELHSFPLWPLKPPLLPTPHKEIEAAAHQLKEILNDN